jgi:cellulose synthase/poly-beta-1,6-N-acetylglucosamine synthase-like glycosyltransferase
VFRSTLADAPETPLHLLTTAWSHTYVLAAWFAQNRGTWETVKRAVKRIVNNPFVVTNHVTGTTRPLYQLDGFDLSILIPYFAVMIVLAMYGMHRYKLVWMYYRNKKNKLVDPPATFAELPRVTIQLPIFNEQYVVDRLVEAICKLDYPKDKLDIQLLDDSTDETVGVARGVVERYAALGNPIVHLHRTNREGFKAGALHEGLKTSKGELVAIFDADFVPPEDWLMKVVHHFTDPKVGMVQTRWTHLNRDYSFLTNVEAILLDGHFVLEHGGRSRSHHI